MPGWLRALLLGSVVALLAGCALWPTTPTTVGELERAGRAEADDEPRAGFGHGTGRTPGAAREAARADLAQQLGGRVLSRFRVESGSEPDEATRHLVGSTHVLARAAVAGIELDHRQQAVDGWYVRLRIPPDRMARLRTEVDRQAPALLWFGRLLDTPAERAGARLIRALKGLAAAHEHGVADDPLYHDDRVLTFATFFEQRVVESTESLEVVPLVEDDAVRFLVLHQASLTPQPRLALKVMGQEMHTDTEGRTPPVDLDDLPRRVPVTLLGDVETMTSLDTLAASPESLHHALSLDARNWGNATETELLLHTRPAGALAEIGDEALTTPGRLRRPDGRRTTVRLTAPEGYRDRDLTLEPPAGAPFHYTSVPLEAEDRGRVLLRTTDTGGRLRLEGDDLLRETRGPRLTAAVPAGEYTVTVFHADDLQRQVLVDTIRVEPNTEVRRRYHPLRTREPYYHGRRGALQLISFAGAPAPDYRLPWGANGHRRFEEVEAEHDPDMDDINIDLTVQGQALFDPFNTLLQGEFGVRSRQFAATSATDDTEMWRLIGHHVAYGAGFWLPLGNSIATLTANQHHGLVSWSGGSRPAGSGDQGVSHDRRYVELGLITPVNVSFSVRVADGGVEPHYLIGFGYGRMRRGHTLPARVRAEEGSHYTVPARP